MFVFAAVRVPVLIHSLSLLHLARASLLAAPCPLVLGVIATSFSCLLH